MNFVSWTFVLLFLPATLVIFHMLRGPRATEARRTFLTAASLGFYAWSGSSNFAVLAASMAVNFAIARLLIATAPARRSRRKMLMWAGILANVGLLLAFKVRAVLFPGPDGFRAEESILIPLALTFVTFQQIGFVAACYRRTVTDFTLRDYLFFIAFFPQLIMGPIVRFQDMAAQVREGRLARAGVDDFAVGLAIFVFGLAQKVLIADQLAPYVDTMFARAALGPVPASQAWFAILGFQLQIYFDFAGYADMAIGLGRMFGVRLPINFDRPLFATDRFDMWRRWHISLVVFMRGHVFMPLVRHWRFPVPVALAVTGLLAGIWHGLGWTFVIWGLLQTALLLVVHFRRRLGLWERGPGKAARVRAIALTFLVACLLSAMFRAPTLEAAGYIYGSLFGLAGEPGGYPRIPVGALAALALTAVAGWLLPNSAQLFRRHWNAIDLRAEGTPPPRHLLERRFGFDLTWRWAAAVAFTLTLCLVIAETARRFIYVQF